jgi:hypothetical protein
MARGKARPSAGTVALEITSSPRCGARGIRAFGHHFTSKPITLPVKDLPPGLAARLCTFAELVVRELDDAGRDVVLKKLPERWGGRWPVPPARSAAGSLVAAAVRAAAKPSSAIASGLAKARRAVTSAAAAVPGPVRAAITPAVEPDASGEPRRRRQRQPGGDDV